MNLCFVTPRFPYPATRGDQVRTYHQIRSLSARHRITLVAACEKEPDAHARAEMERWCERIETVPLSFSEAPANLTLGALFTGLPLQVLLHTSSRFRRRFTEVLASQPFDVVHASLIRMAPYVWDINTPVVVDLVDALSRSIAGRSSHVSWPLRRAYEIERKRVERYEREVCERFSHAIVCAQADADALPGQALHVIRNAVDTDAFAFTLDGRDEATVIMTGNMGYHPNIDAAVWFATSIWPQVRHAVPNARLRFVGARPALAVRRLARLPGVEVTGPVRAMNDHLRRATLAICPMRCGSGIQNKVLEALACGTPMISTPLGNQGVAAIPDRELLVAQEADAFAQATIALLRDASRRRELALAARALIERDFAWETHARNLEAVYLNAAAS